MTPDHVARAYAMLYHDGLALGNIAIAEVLATQLAEVDRLTRERDRLNSLLSVCDVSPALASRMGLTLATAMAGWREGHEDSDDDEDSPTWPDGVDEDDEKAAHICNVTIEPMACLTWLLDNAERLADLYPEEPQP